MAVAAGLSDSTFWGMTPKELRWYMDGYNRIKDRRDDSDAECINATAWLNGMYVSRAIAACFARNVNYPKKPVGGKEQEKSAAQMAMEFEAMAQIYNQKFNP